MGIFFNFSSDDNFGPIEHDFLCLWCGVTVLGRGYYRNGVSQHWCAGCLEALRVDAMINKPYQMPWRQVPRAQHDVIMAEATGGDATHPGWCFCGWCKPLMQEARE